MIMKENRQVGEKCSKKNQQSGSKETKQFWSKIWRRKEYNRNFEWMNNMKKELELNEGSEGKHTPWPAKSNTEANTQLENTKPW